MNVNTDRSESTCNRHVVSSSSCRSREFVVRSSSISQVVSCSGESEMILHRSTETLDMPKVVKLR